MVLIETLNDFGIPFDVIFIFGHERLFNVIEEVVRGIIGIFFYAFFLVMMMNFGVLIGFFEFGVGVGILDPYQSVIDLLHYTLRKFRLNVTTYDTQKFVCFGMLWQIV